jgi:hypothetical protein
LFFFHFWVKEGLTSIFRPMVRNEGIQQEGVLKFENILKNILHITIKGRCDHTSYLQTRTRTASRFTCLAFRFFHAGIRESTPGPASRFTRSVPFLAPTHRELSKSLAATASAAALTDRLADLLPGADHESEIP